MADEILNELENPINYTEEIVADGNSLRKIRTPDVIVPEVITISGDINAAKEELRKSKAAKQQWVDKITKLQEIITMYKESKRYHYPVDKEAVLDENGVVIEEATFAEMCPIKVNLVIGSVECFACLNIKKYNIEEGWIICNKLTNYQELE